MNHIEKHVLEQLDFKAMLQFLDELVSLQSLDGTPQENEAQRLVAAKLRSMGFEVDEWAIDFDMLKKHPSYSAEVERPAGIGVVGEWGAGTGPTLLFNGHTDVVPAGDLSRWLFDP